MKQPPKHIFQKTTLSIVFIFGLGVFLLFRSEKPKAEYHQISGKILSIGLPNDIIPIRNPEKYRNIKLVGFEKTFQVFIGHDKLDFKPKFEKITELKSNDSITVFFLDDVTSPKNTINRLVQFIDRGSESIFIKGRADEYFGHILAILAIVSFIILYALKKKNIIT
jgi:hypothetical protein